MAENYDKVVRLIEVEIDNKAAQRATDSFTDKIIDQQKAVKENNEAIRDLNSENKNLEKQVKKGEITQAQASKAIDENNKKSKELTKQNFSLKDGIKDLNKERASALKATKLQSNTLDALRKKVIDQKKELNGLKLENKEGSVEFNKLSASMKKNNDLIVELDQSAGDYRTTVARYKEETVGAIKNTKFFGTTLGGVFDMLKANPLILLVSTLSSLAVAYGKTQSGAEFFRKTGAGINIVFGMMLDKVEALGNALTSPKESFLELYDVVKNKIGNYFSSVLPAAIDRVIGGFGVLWEAVKTLDFDLAVDGMKSIASGISDIEPISALAKHGFYALRDGVSELGKEIVRTTSAAFKLEEQLIANEKATKNQEVAVAKNIASQKQLNRIIEDQSLSYSVRLEAAQKFNEEEERQAAISVRLAKERVDILKAQNDLTNSTEEDIQRVRDAEIALAQLQAASAERLVTNNNKLFGIKKQQQAEEEKEALALNSRMLALAEARRANETEILMSGLEGSKYYYETKRAIVQEEFNKDLEQLATNRSLLMENESLSNEERLIALEENDLAVQDRRISHANEMTSIADKQASEELAIEKQKQSTMASIAKRGQDAVQNIISIANSLIIRKAQKKQDEIDKLLEAGTISEQEHAWRSGQIERQKALDQYEIEKKAFFLKKAINLASAGIDIARGITATLALGFPVGTTLAPWVAGLGAIQVGAIIAEPPPVKPSFKDGGTVVKGKSHAQGGEDIYVGGQYMGEMEGDEAIFVTNKAATKQLIDQANTENGGRSMFAESQKHLQDGGRLDTSNQMEAMKEAFISAVMALPTPVVEAKSVMGAINAERESENIGVI